MCLAQLYHQRSQNKALLQSRVDYQNVPEVASVADRVERGVTYEPKLQGADIRLLKIKASIRNFWSR
jgi:hypothetical protein